ncbi:hypothetical protein WJX77_010087 [Trebouxia sp. C0004]
MRNCQLPEDKIAGIEVQLVAANRLSYLLCPHFNGQLSTPEQTALQGATFLSWAKSAYEPRFITAAVQKSQFNLSNIDFIIFVMARLVDRQDNQQCDLPATGGKQTPIVDLSIPDRIAAARHISQINAVMAAASDPRRVASSSGKLLDRDDDLLGLHPGHSSPWSGCLDSIP